MSRSQPSARFRLNLNELESRDVPATIRIAAYNIEADIDGVTTPRSGLYQVLEGIGEEVVQGDVQPLDILTLEETTSNSTTVAPIVTNLNSYYNGLAVYAQSPYQATEEGGDTADGNGPNALIYNTSTLKLLASVGVGTPEGSENGEYRQVVRYEFQPVGDSGSTGIFYVYVSHMKSGTTSADATDRGEEATIIRNDEATLPASASVLYTGDLNSAPPEAEFTEFTASGQGEAYDPVNFSTSVQYYSESATDLEYRDDYELMTSNVLNDTGAINYVSGSFHAFGNNGTTPERGSVDSGSDTALNSDLVQDGGTFISASTLYADLTTASDHLPAVADYTLPVATPTITSASSPGSLTVGSTMDDVATVSGGNNPTGTVTFNLYSSATTQNSSTLLYTDANVSLSGGTATSGNYTTAAAGTDYWVDTYNGDSNNNPATGGAGADPVTVNKASPSISSASNPGTTTVGNSIDDVATVSGGFSPSGTVTFNLYSSATTQNSSTLLYTDANVSLSSGTATSGNYTTTATGTDYWVDTYNGDGNNNPATGSASGDSVTVTASTTFQFGASSYSTVSDNTMVNLTVTRTNGSGSENVYFYTGASGDTAVAGTDYTQTGTQSSPIEVSFTGSQTSATIQVPILLWTGTPYSNTKTFTVTLENPSSGTALGSQTTTQVDITDPQLQVTSVTDTPTGFIVNFNRQFQPAPVHLYVSPDPSATPTPASLTLMTTGGSPTLVNGTLVLNPSGTSAQFIVTNINSGNSDLSPSVETLTPGANYSLALVGGSTAFLGFDGRALTGTTSFTVTPPAATNFTLSVPDVVAGPGETTIAAPNENGTSGIPIYVNSANGSAITSVTFTLTYNPAILSIANNAATLSSAFSNAGFSITNAVYSAGSITLTVSGGSITPSSGSVQLPVVYFTANIPSGTALRLKGLLDLSSNAIVNGSAATPNDGVDLNAYLGNVSGSGAYSPLDVTEVKRVANLFGQNSGSNEYVGFAESGSGQTSYQDVDPALMGDFTQHTGIVSPVDATGIARAQAGNPLAPASLISLPTNGNAVTGGVDPYVYLEPMSSPPLSAVGPTGTGTSESGTPITYALHINVPSSASTIAFDAGSFAVEFDASLVQISNVTAGTALPKGFSEADNGQSSYDSTGELHISLSTSGNNDDLAPGTDTIVATFTVTPNGDRPAGIYAQAIRILNNHGAFQTQVFNGNQTTTLIPAPVNGRPNPDIDSSIVVESVISATKLSLQTLGVGTGSSFSLAVDYINGPSQINVDAASLAIQFEGSFVITAISSAYNTRSIEMPAPATGGSFANAAVVQDSADYQWHLDYNEAGNIDSGTSLNYFADTLYSEMLP